MCTLKLQSSQHVRNCCHVITTSYNHQKVPVLRHYLSPREVATLFCNTDDVVLAGLLIVPVFVVNALNLPG